MQSIHIRFDACQNAGAAVERTAISTRVEHCAYHTDRIEDPKRKSSLRSMNLALNVQKKRTQSWQALRQAAASSGPSQTRLQERCSCCPAYALPPASPHEETPSSQSSIGAHTTKPSKIKGSALLLLQLHHRAGYGKLPKQLQPSHLLHPSTISQVGVPISFASINQTSELGFKPT